MCWILYCVNIAFGVRLDTFPVYSPIGYLSMKTYWTAETKGQRNGNVRCCVFRGYFNCIVSLLTLCNVAGVFILGFRLSVLYTQKQVSTNGRCSEVSGTADGADSVQPQWVVIVCRAGHMAK